MIKRRFYRYEHGDKDAPSESSSSSDSDVEAEATDETEVEEDDEEENIAANAREKGEASSSSGYESEDSSANEVNLDSSGLPTSDEDVVVQNSNLIIGGFPSTEGNTLIASPHHSPVKDEVQLDATNCVLKCKSVFKCRLCPRIVCLSEETLKAHLTSKRHARSEKLLKEGRLKLMLNDDGKIEGETRAENDSETTVSGQKSTKPKKKCKGRWKDRKRVRREPGKARRSTENREKRRKGDS